MRLFHWFSLPPLPPSVFDMCVYREIIGAPSNRTKEWNLNDTRIILWAFICARIRIDRSIRFKLFHRTYYYLHAPISYILIIKTSIKTQNVHRDISNHYPYLFFAHLFVSCFPRLLASYNQARIQLSYYHPITQITHHTQYFITDHIAIPTRFYHF